MAEEPVQHATTDADDSSKKLTQTDRLQKAAAKLANIMYILKLGRRTNHGRQLSGLWQTTPSRQPLGIWASFYSVDKFSSTESITANKNPHLSHLSERIENNSNTAMYWGWFSKEQSKLHMNHMKKKLAERRYTTLTRCEPGAGGQKVRVTRVFVYTCHVRALTSFVYPMLSLQKA
jgi:hypothetical protein